MRDIELTHRMLSEARYDAVIEGIELRKGYIPVLLVITYRIPYGGEDFYVHEELAIDAPKNSPRYDRTYEGKRRVIEILASFGEKPPPTISEPDLEDALIGREVRISVRIKKNGYGNYPRPFVDAILGKANPFRRRLDEPSPHPFRDACAGAAPQRIALDHLGQRRDAVAWN
jgi:hypothetical protein